MSFYTIPKLQEANLNQCRQLMREGTPVWFWGVVCTKRLAVLHSHTWYYNGMQHSTTTAETSTTGTTHGFSTSSTKISTTQIGGWWSVQCCCAMGRPSGSSSSQGDQFRGRRWPGRRNPRRRQVQDVLQPHDSTQMSALFIQMPFNRNQYVLSSIDVQTLSENHNIIIDRNSKS